MMVKEFIAKLMGWERQEPRESNWTKANMELSVEDRNSIMSKAKEDMKKELKSGEEEKHEDDVKKAETDLLKAA